MAVIKALDTLAVGAERHGSRAFYIGTRVDRRPTSCTETAWACRLPLADLNSLANVFTRSIFGARSLRTFGNAELSRLFSMAPLARAALGVLNTILAGSYGLLT